MTTLARPYVIIADNNEFYRQALGDHFRGLSYDVDIAQDGLEALVLLEKRRPDLMVLDLIMPRIDGGRLAAFVRSQERWNGLPIILLSGVLPDEIDGADAMRADAWIAKMPLELMSEALRSATSAVLCKDRPAECLMIGFDKMYRREVVLELLQERRTRREILESLSEGIVELSLDRRILNANAAFERMAESPASAILARRLEEIFPQAADDLGGLFALLESGKPLASTTLAHSGRDLRVTLHALTPSPLGKGGVANAIDAAQRTTEKVKLESMIAAVGYTLLVGEITEKVRAERERRQMAERLALSERMSALSVFVSGAAHELNNPLAGVLGFAERLGKRTLDEGARRDVERILSGAERCRQVLVNLASFARTLRHARARVNLNQVVRDAVGDFAGRVASCGITLDLDLNPTVPDLLIDAAQMREALRQITDNAVLAMEDSPTGRLLRITTRRLDGSVEVAVSDSGPGIREADLSRIFEPFFTTREVGKGKGLGLSIAWGVVAAHGGRIEAQNRAGSGATILIRMPESDPDQTDPEISTAS